MGLVEKGLEFLDWITARAGYRNDWIVVREADTSPDYGVLPYQRSIQDHVNFGVINLDKPPGPTSHEVVAWVKQMLGVEKAGHGGTLEPALSLKGRAGIPQSNRRTASWAGEQYEGYWKRYTHRERVLNGCPVTRERFEG